MLNINKWKVTYEEFKKNAEEELEGVYFDAGCVLGKDEIDIFDIFSALSYINTGDFSE